MMKLKTKLTTLAFLSAMSVSHSSLAATFCGNRTNVSYGGAETITGDLDANRCVEVGAWNYGGDGGYAGTASNVNMLSGSLMSVLGFMENSTVNSGAEVYITQVTKIAVDGFDSTVPATASNITIYAGGLARVYDGGTLKDSYLDGGTAYISNSGSTGVTGKAIDNNVSNGGKLFVYNGGVSDGTIINQGGYEYAQQSGISSNARINGGIQYVTSSGVANGATVNEDGRQYVYNGGSVNNTIINSGGSQYLFINGTDTSAIAGVANNTTLNGTGAQIIQQGGRASTVTLNDSAVQTIYSGSSAENVTLNDATVQVVYGNATAENVTLNDNAKSWLANNAVLTGATRVNDSGQLQLSTSADGGARAENVTLDGSNATLLIIANSNDSDEATIGELSGTGAIRYYAGSDPSSSAAIYSRLNVDSLSGNLHFYFNTSLEGGKGDYLQITQGTGNHNVTVTDSGAEITEPGKRRLDIITDASGGANFNLATLTGTNINAVDGGTYMYSLYERDESSGKIWYLASEKESTSETPEPGPGEEIPTLPTPENPDTGISKPKTTPATDAVLSMSVAPVLMFKNEMQNLRFRQGLSEKTEGDNGAWVRFTGGNTNIDSGLTDFKLDQSGVELGADRVIATENAKTRVGLFTSYNSGKVKHARGGVSRIDSLSVGAQATWFHNDGWYVDGVLKYNHFDNSLSAISTNGSGISADYNQNALGAAVEVGKSLYLQNHFWIEPYAKLAAIQVKGEDVKLNNGMKGSIGDQDSLSTEAGFNLGRTFLLNKGTTITPYFKAAWVHEYVDNNSTTINDRNTFTTDLSGDIVKTGLGVNASFNKELSLFAEVDYAKGSKQEDPVQANLGFRYSF